MTSFNYAFLFSQKILLLLCIMTILECGNQSNENQYVEEINKIETYFANRQIAEIVPLLNKVLEADPQNRIALLYTCKVSFYLKKYTDAITDCSILLEYHPEYIEAKIIKSRALISSGKKENVDEAIKILDSILQYDTLNSQAWYWKGRALERSGNHGDAIASYNTAIHQTQTLANAYSRLANLYKKAGLNDVSRKYQLMSKAIDYNSFNASLIEQEPDQKNPKKNNK